MVYDGQERDIELDRGPHRHVRALAIATRVGSNSIEPSPTTPLLSAATVLSDGSPRLNSLSTSGANPRSLMIPFLLYCTAVGAVAVPKINIILALMCTRDQPNRHGKTISSDDICSTPRIHAEMGRFVTYGNLMSGLLCMWSSPRLGRLSDRYGRRPLIAFSALGMLSGDIMSVIAAFFPDRISVYWILLEFVIGGLTGAFVTTVAFVQSYATDCTTPGERAKVFSQLHACMYLGMALGPAAGAYLVRDVGHGNILLVFYVAGICHLLFIFYVLLGIPESLTVKILKKSEQRPTANQEGLSALSKMRRVIESCNIFQPLTMFRSSSATAAEGNSRANLPALAVIDALAFGVQLGLPQLLVLFSEYQLGWKNFETNLFVSVTNTTRAITLAILLPQVLKLIKLYYSKKTTPLSDYVSDGIHDESDDDNDSHDNDDEASSALEARKTNILAIRGAILLDLLGTLGFAMSYVSPLFTISGILAATGAPASPVVLSCMTTYVGPERVGELFGAIGLLHALARALIPPMMQLGYSLTLENVPHALFWALSVLFGIAFLTSLQMRP